MDQDGNSLELRRLYNAYNSVPSPISPDERMFLNRLQFETLANYVQQKYVLSSQKFQCLFNNYLYFLSPQHANERTLRSNLQISRNQTTSSLPTVLLQSNLVLQVKIITQYTSLKNKNGTLAVKQSEAQNSHNK